MRIIGIAGQLASGKDTVADYLAEKLNIGRKSMAHVDDWTRIGFANAVKKIYMDAFGVDSNFIEEWKRRDEPPPGFDKNVRRSLQFIGDGFRQIKSNVWIEKVLCDDKKIIISDVRYINEAKAIKERNGVTVVLWRPGFENDDPNLSESQIKPVVDWCAKNFQDGPIPCCDAGSLFLEDIKYFDFFLKNDGTKEDLYAKINNILVPYLKELENESFRVSKFGGETGR